MCVNYLELYLKHSKVLVMISAEIVVRETANGLSFSDDLRGLSVLGLLSMDTAN